MNEIQSDIDYNNKTYFLERYPQTDEKSLRAWSSAEILAMNYFSENYVIDNVLTHSTDIYLYHDRFGVWNCLLSDFLTTEHITTVISYASQQKAISHNLTLNELVALDESQLRTPLEALTSSTNNDEITKRKQVVLLKVPKSLDLFELYLQQIHKLAMTQESTLLDIEVVCSFMTKYFTKSLIEIASRYFDSVEQSQAWKKSRLILLSKPKTLSQPKASSKSQVLSDDHVGDVYPCLTREMMYNDTLYKQYSGVFSAGKIDIGTQFLLEQFTNGNLQIKKSELKVLDLACGNGVIARELKKHADTSAEFTLVDDFTLAVESAKLNMEDAGNNPKENFVCDDNLSSFEEESFDLVISNPPFHFEYENNSEVSLVLFEDVHRVLKPNKRFILVANKHLDYKLYLEELFTKVFVIETNSKFAIYECVR